MIAAENINTVYLFQAPLHPLRFGVLFCPFLPAIGFMRNILVFYLRTVAVFVFDKPPQTLFRVASTHNFYMAILLVTVFLSSLPVGFAMIEMRPSLRCGPFRSVGVAPSGQQACCRWVEAEIYLATPFLSYYLVQGFEQHGCNHWQ